MDIKQYLDSTYLKTAIQAGTTPQENIKIVEALTKEAVEEGFKLVMVRPDMISVARNIISDLNSKVLVGTVVDFPGGEGALLQKLEEASRCIDAGADELDFVVNYKAFKRGEADKVKADVLECSKFALANKKVVKWIIETAALTEQEIIRLTVLIKNVVFNNFEEKDYFNVFVKSSTGFYISQDGRPNGATPEAIVLMVENSYPLPVKAAGGVKSYEEALAMIKLGVKRIGTSSAKAVAGGEFTPDEY